jgi:hypothetical protein
MLAKIAQTAIHGDARARESLIEQVVQYTYRHAPRPEAPAPAAPQPAAAPRPAPSPHQATTNQTFADAIGGVADKPRALSKGVHDGLRAIVAMEGQPEVVASLRQSVGSAPLAGPELVRVMSESKDPALRKAATGALIYSTDPGVAALLKGVAEKGPTSSARCHATAVLASQALEPQTEAFLRYLATKSPDQNVRMVDSDGLAAAGPNGAQARQGMWEMVAYASREDAKPKPASARVARALQLGVAGLAAGVVAASQVKGNTTGK